MPEQLSSDQSQINLGPCGSVVVDPNYHNYFVNIAVLQTAVNNIKQESDAHVIELSPRYVSYPTFLNLFFKDGKFSPNKQLGHDAQATVSNKDRYILSGPTDQVYNLTDTSNVITAPVFNLTSALISTYANDLGCEPNCWDPCDLVHLQNTINPIQTLFSVIQCCQNNIECSMTLDQFFASLEAQGMVMDPASGFPLDPVQSDPPGVIYQGVVCASVTVIFKSSTDDVKDLEVNWPFLINFNSYANGGAFSLSAAGNILNNYPHIWKLPSYLLPVSTLFSENNRSDPFLTEDIVDDTGRVVSAIPQITRYNVGKYSNLSLIIDRTVVETILRYNSDLGQSFDWAQLGHTFTLDPYLPQFSYTAITISIPNYATVPYRAELISAIIGDNVKIIGVEAFYDCEALTSAIIGAKVKSIGAGAFSYCTSLPSVTIPNSVTSIGEDAFHVCRALTSAIIGANVKSIGIEAFYECDLLRFIEIPNSVTSMGDRAFGYCVSLTSVIIGASVKSIGEGAFSLCEALTSVYISQATATRLNADWDPLPTGAIHFYGLATGVNFILQP